MNKQRRARLEKLSAAIDELKLMLEMHKDDLEEIKYEEQDAFDNMPESLQGSERGQAAEEAIGTLEDALSCLDDAAQSLEAVTAGIEAITLG